MLRQFNELLDRLFEFIIDEIAAGPITKTELLAVLDSTDEQLFSMKGFKWR